MKPKVPMTSGQMTPGIMVSLDGKIYRVESAVKVTVTKGNPFIKTKLKNMMTDELIEKNFKEGQAIEEVMLDERDLEFLYVEGKDYLFLDVGNLDKILIPKEVIGDRVNFIKEGVAVKAMFYGTTIFSIELPQFLELMIVKTDDSKDVPQMSNGTKAAYLETGAKIDVPLFIETGDIVKVETASKEYIQRV